MVDYNRQPKRQERRDSDGEPVRVQFDASKQRRARKDTRRVVRNG